MNNYSLFKVRGGWMLPAFFTMLLLLCVTVCSAQTVPISGTITDAQGVLPGVNVQIKNKAIATATDASGNFDIQALPEDTLIVSSMGYLTLEVPVGSQTTFNLTLVEDATALEEVTVNAGYYKVTDRERTGSIASIKAADIELQPVSSPLAAMQGRMAGVNITQASGVAGGGFSIQIRGINSLRAEGNDPLYIVDGVPYASQSLGNSDVSANSFAGMSSPLSTINPTDIASIDVLKDADATAIYGSRGANGVVLITTKKGKSGKTVFNINSSSTVGKVARKTDLLNTQQYLAMRREAYQNDGITEFPEDAYDVNGTWDQRKFTDWQKELIGGTAYTTLAQATVSGGSSDTQFMVSGTYRNETSVFPGDASYDRGNLHTSIAHKTANEKFNIQLTTDYSADKNTLPGIDLTSAALKLAPNAPELYDNNGNLNWENGTFQNPVAILQSEYLNQTRSLIINTLLSYRFLPDFEFKTSIGYSSLQFAESRTRPYTIYAPSQGYSSADSQLYKNEGVRTSWIVEPQIGWQKKWGLLKLHALAGATFQSQQQESFAIMGAGFASDALLNTIAAARTTMILQDDVAEYKYNAFFGRLNFNLNERYLLNLTGRRDGSSRFGPKNRFANFGAVGAAWIFSNESFLENTTNILSFGKIRSSFGITGNDQIGDYQYIDTYTVTPNVYDGITGIQPSRLHNPYFGWETNKKFEVAMDLGFLQDRFFVSAAWFRNRSGNQLVGMPLPGTTGFSSMQSNLDANVQNTGFEFVWNSNNIKKANWQWTTSANVTFLENKLLSFPGLEGSTYESSYVLGESLNVQQLYHYTGINPTTGLYTFEDYNSDGLYNSEDRKFYGDTSPKYYGGVSNEITYKNWSFEFLLQFVKQEALSVLSRYATAGTFNNQPISVLNHFPQDTENSAVQQYTTGQNYNSNVAYSRWQRSDAALVDASFIRLKNVSLAYSLPTTWSNTFQGKLYLQSQNLLTFTPYKDGDPENKSAQYLPPLQQFSIGAQLTF